MNTKFIAEDQELSIDPQIKKNGESNVVVKTEKKGGRGKDVSPLGLTTPIQCHFLKQSDDCPSQNIHSERHARHQHHSLVCTRKA